MDILLPKNNLLKEILLENNRSLILIISLMLLTGLVQATSVLGLMPIVDFVINQEESQHNEITQAVANQLSRLNIPVNILSLGILYLSLVLVRSIILALQKYVTTRTIFKVMKQLIYGLYESFLNTSLAFFNTKQYGTLANTVVKETEKASIGFESLAQMIASSISLIFYFLLLLFLSWQLSLLILILTIILLSPSIFLNKYVYKIRKKHTEASNLFQGKMYDTLNSLKLITGFSKREDTAREVQPSVNTVAKTSVQFTMVRVLFSLIAEPVSVFLVVFSILVGLNYLSMGISELIAFLYAINRLAVESQSVITQRNNIFASLPSFEQIHSLKYEAENSKESKDGKKITSFSKGIFIENLSFSYDNQEEVLSDINLKVPIGTMVAVVGSSGSGKSTLIDLIMGFYLSQKGTLKIDNDFITKISLRDWRLLSGYIPQQPFLFNASIKDNLLWARKEATDSEIEQACRLANAEEFILDLKEKYNTLVGERGVRLSGGQAQRICLARALIKKPQLLILDEATSALDSHSELLIQDSIEKLTGETTIISIAHRLSTIKKATRIYHLDMGRIVEEGTFEELIASKDGFFRRTAELQGIV